MRIVFIYIAKYILYNVYIDTSNIFIWICINIGV